MTAGSLTTSDFYPRPPRGGRLLVAQCILNAAEFLSTPSARRATCSGRRPHPAWTDFYPRPPRGGRPSERRAARAPLQISIHALREEGDFSGRVSPSGSLIFLSTPSARRATKFLHGIESEVLDFYPRPPRGGRPATTSPRGSQSYFYPRPPRGGRPSGNGAPEICVQFLSTPSARRATSFSRVALRVPSIFLSTPSARRATSTPARRRSWLIYFYPRPPRGGRRYTSASHWRDIDISIHALREEGDRDPVHAQRLHRDFYPRPPRGGRPQAEREFALWSEFLSTPSARRATVSYSFTVLLLSISIHALREEGDSKNRDKISIFKQIVQHSARI